MTSQEITYLKTSAIREKSYQTAEMRSLIKVFSARINYSATISNKKSNVMTSEPQLWAFAYAFMQFFTGASLGMVMNKANPFYVVRMILVLF